LQLLSHNPPSETPSRRGRSDGPLNDDQTVAAHSVHKRDISQTVCGFHHRASKPIVKRGAILMRNTVQHWSFGGTSAAIAPVTNPATGAVTGEVALGSLRRL
jgi:hypothetical protein